MPEILNLKGAVDLLKMTTATIDYLVQTNQITFSRVGKRGVRFLDKRLLSGWKKGKTSSFAKKESQG